jgi:hypothetical protein
MGSVIQFPVFAQALLLAYNVEAISSPDDPNLVRPLPAGLARQWQLNEPNTVASVCCGVVQVLDRQTIGRIWTGSIRLWNDSAIQALNPAVAAKLPPVPITLGYGPEHQLAIIEVAKQAMSSFSDEFRDALAAANNSIARMAPAMEGRAFDAGSNASLRISWIQVRRSAACMSPLPHSPSYAYARTGAPQLHDVLALRPRCGGGRSMGQHDQQGQQLRRAQLNVGPGGDGGSCGRVWRGQHRYEHHRLERPALVALLLHELPRRVAQYHCIRLHLHPRDARFHGLGAHQ